MNEHDPRILAEDRAPTPFTADEIRRGCPPGRTIVVATERSGEPTTYRQIQFMATDATSATQRFTSLDGDGRQVGEPEVRTTTWEELQAHASFPAEQTTIADDAIDTELGTLECRRYEVADGEATQTFWFAEALPGMPVRFTRHEQGRLVTATTMTTNRLDRSR